MFKKIIKSIIKDSNHHKHLSSSDAWKYHKSNKYGHLGHHHYKHKHKSKSGSFFSSFFSS